ncbi:MAG: YihY/virulence factor BrkB family protein [Desulfomonilaceae bacterium]
MTIANVNIGGVMFRVISKIWQLLRDSINCWAEDHAPRMAAALAFYTIFSAGPALLIGLSVAEAFLGEAAESELSHGLKEFVGPVDPAVVMGLLESAKGKIAGKGLPIFGILAAIAAAMAAFSELQSSLGTIWRHRPDRGRGVLHFLYTRVISFVFVAAIGILIIISAVTGAVVAAVNSLIVDMLPTFYSPLELVNTLTSLAMLPTLLFLSYKFMPPVRIPFLAALSGAVFAWVLLLAGKWAVGLYLGVTGVRSVYGAAGSLVVLMIWVYYSAQIFFLGAEFTKVFTGMRLNEKGVDLLGSCS